MRIVSLLLFLFPAAFSFAQQHEPEYVYVSQDALGIAGFSVNHTDGSLVALPTLPINVAGPIAAAPTGQFVFTGNPGITAAAIDRATGNLTVVPGSPFGTLNTLAALAVTPSGKFLIAASGTQLLSYTIDGNLGAVTPTGPPIDIPGGRSAVSLAISPSGNIVYAGTTSGNTYECSLSPYTGALTLNQGTNANGTYLAISPNGKYLYTAVVEPFTSSTSIYTYSISAGNLTLVPGSPFTGPGSEMPILGVDLSGKFLYEGIFPKEMQSIAGYLINPTTGAVESSIIGSPFPVTGIPDGFAFDLLDHFVYVAGSEGDVVDEYAINRQSGALTPLAGMPRVQSLDGITLVAPKPPSTATLTKLSIEPVNPSVVSGTVSSVQFTAVGAYSDGTHRFLTASVTWSSTDSSVATISNAPGQSGVATIAGPGSTVVSAVLNGMTAQTQLTVTPAVLESIAVTPIAPTISALTDIQFTATGTYADGSTKNITQSVAWSSTNPAVAAVNRTGIAQGKSGGTATIQATSGSIAGSTTLTVVAAAVAPVNETGIAQGKSGGTAAIQATSESIAGSTLTVISAAD